MTQLQQVVDQQEQIQIAQANATRQAKMELARRKKFSSLAGIGTRERNRQVVSTCAVYITGLPQHCQGTQVQELKDQIQSWFGSLGSIQKVIVYVNHGGKSKGDGLVVYNVKTEGGGAGIEVNEVKVFLDHVCLQVRD